MSISGNFRELLRFFILAYSISWVIWLPLYGPALGLTVLPVLPYHHALGGLGPMIAALLLTYIEQGNTGMRQLLKRMVLPGAWLYLGMALAGPFILTLVVTGALDLLEGTTRLVQLDFTSEEFPQFGVTQVFLYNLVFFGFGEETGWRGYALPRLQQKFNALSATVFLTLLWALWHWPLFLYRPGYVAMGVSGLVGWHLSLFTGALLLTWLFNSTKGSILVCAVFHSTIDVAFTAKSLDVATMNGLGILITLAGILILAIFKPKNLSHQSRIT